MPNVQKSLFMKLITITGPSGAGKDTLARMLSRVTNTPVLCSFTTRPIREGEKNGREHYFVPSCDVPKKNMLAYRQYGGYEYWLTLDQLRAVAKYASRAIYVVDAESLVEMTARFPNLDIFSIYISASKETRLARGVSEERIKRDEAVADIKFPYDYVYENNDDSSDAFMDLVDIVRNL
jgi:guanylate kinase